MPLKSCIHPIDKIQGAEEERANKKESRSTTIHENTIPELKSQAPNNNGNNKKNMKGTKKLKGFWTSNRDCNNHVTKLYREVVKPKKKKKGNNPKLRFVNFVLFANFEVCLKEQTPLVGALYCKCRMKKSQNVLV
jgi:hypothetical protein